LWADATKRNINYSIALLLDDKVLMAPTIRSEINGGNCEITGNFTQRELRFIAAIGNNRELPVGFVLLK
jgi:preprotein translocase subunit SecD